MNRDIAVIHLRDNPLLFTLSDRDLVDALRAAGVIAPSADWRAIDIQNIIAEADGHSQGTVK